jgi:predicted PurR-regulated permease PerM
MAFFDTNRQRAALLVTLLGMGLAIALAPFATGLIGAVVLYVVFAPVNNLVRRQSAPGLAAVLTTGLALVLILVPGVSFAGLIVSQAQEMATGVVRSPLLGKLGDLRVAGYEV